jgi:hypothetical protein
MSYYPYSLDAVTVYSGGGNDNGIDESYSREVPKSPLSDRLGSRRTSTSDPKQLPWTSGRFGLRTENNDDQEWEELKDHVIKNTPEDVIEKGFLIHFPPITSARWGRSELRALSTVLLTDSLCRT